jgi:hypothetical protein
MARRPYHTNMDLFRFFVDEVGWLVMQYKISPVDVLWSPKDGLTIRLWKRMALDIQNS